MRNHRGTETQRHHTQRHRTITTSQTQRLEDTKESRSHRSLDSRTIGPGTTAQSRGIEVKEGRSTNACVWRSTFLHLGSFLRNAHPASMTAARSSPHVTLSEGVRRVSRRVPRKHAGRHSLSVTQIFGGFSDSLHSLRMTSDWATPCGRPRLHRVPPPPSKKRESGAPVSPRRSRRAMGTTGRGIDWTRQKLVFGESRRFHGGGGRRPSPTPPPEDQIRVDP